MLGCVCKCLAVSTAVVGILIGLLFAGILQQHVPIYDWLDQANVGRGQVFKGMFTQLHSEPWGYTFEELGQLDLSGKTIFITGANTGLGFWTAHHLAQRDADVSKFILSEVETVVESVSV